MEEIKQMIEEEANKLYTDMINNCPVYTDAQTAYVEGYDAGMDDIIRIILSKWQEAERWRKVSEELPEEGKIVLFKTIDSKYYVGFNLNGKPLLQTDNVNQIVIEWKPIN